MSQIGCLGDIVFRVSADVIETADRVIWSGSARYAEHRRHLGNALTEFTGVDADKFSFEITLMDELGADVMGELVKIWGYERKGTALPLVLGTKFYGKHRWSIINHRIAMKYFDPEGNLTGAAVSISLLEYVNV